jgi:hypothetical protein
LIHFYKSLTMSRQSGLGPQEAYQRTSSADSPVIKIIENQIRMIANMVQNYSIPGSELNKIKTVCSSVENADKMGICKVLVGGFGTFISIAENQQEKRKDFEETVKNELGEIKLHLNRIEDLGKQTLQIISEKTYMEGAKQIVHKFKTLCDKIDLKEWAYYFKNNKDQFEDTTRYFESENLKKLFQFVLETRCTESIDPLIQVHDYMVIARVMYYYIQVVFLQHLPDQVPHEKPDHVIKTAVYELKNVQKDLSRIHDTAVKVYPIIYAVKTMDLNVRNLLSPVYVPDIPEDKEYLKSSQVKAYKLQAQSWFNQKTSSTYTMYGPDGLGKEAKGAVTPVFRKFVNQEDTRESYTRKYASSKWTEGPLKAIWNNGEIHYGYQKGQEYLVTLAVKAGGNIIHLTDDRGEGRLSLIHI